MYIRVVCCVWSSHCNCCCSCSFSCSFPRSRPFADWQICLRFPRLADTQTLIVCHTPETWFHCPGLPWIARGPALSLRGRLLFSAPAMTVGPVELPPCRTQLCRQQSDVHRANIRDLGRATEVAALTPPGHGRLFATFFHATLLRGDKQEEGLLGQRYWLFSVYSVNLLARIPLF